jgi:hypothetical protein
MPYGCDRAMLEAPGPYAEPWELFPATVSRYHWYAGSGVDVPAEAQLRKHSHGTANEEPPRAQENPFGHRLPPVVVDALGQWYPFSAVQGAQ